MNCSRAWSAGSPAGDERRTRPRPVPTGSRLEDIARPLTATGGTGPGLAWQARPRRSAWPRRPRRPPRAACGGGNASGPRVWCHPICRRPGRGSSRNPGTRAAPGTLRRSPWPGRSASPRASRGNGEEKVRVRGQAGTCRSPVRGGPGHGHRGVLTESELVSGSCSCAAASPHPACYTSDRQVFARRVRVCGSLAEGQAGHCAPNLDRPGHGLTHRHADTERYRRG